MYKNICDLTLYNILIIFLSYFPYFILWCFANNYNTTIQNFDFYVPKVYGIGIIKRPPKINSTLPKVMNLLQLLLQI